MTTKTKVWIDPADCGLPTVEATERKRKEEAERQRRQEVAQRRQEYEERQRRWKAEEAMKRKEEEEKARNHALVAQPKAEILPPAAKVPALPLPDANSLGLPDLSDLERQIRHSAKMLDLSVPEGTLDNWFGRPNHRIAVKTDRAQLLFGYIAACGSIMESARQTIEAAGAAQRARYQLQIDRLTAYRSLMTEYYRLECAHREALRQEAIKDAKARTEIAKHEADAREHALRGRPLPPSPPPPPPPKPEDPRAKNKARLQQELQRLAKEEKEELARIAGGKPQGEWTDDVQEEIKRTVNMYFHAKEKIREELRKYL